MAVQLHGRYPPALAVLSPLAVLSDRGVLPALAVLSDRVFLPDRGGLPDRLRPPDRGGLPDRLRPHVPVGRVGRQGREEALKPGTSQIRQ
jgi:hypothetical protein